MNRTNNVEKLKKEAFDLLIIGGGITGAGIALDASQRGINTALIDMQDFAAGTSSRSTKLVHGGLRYLKQLQVGLVAEVGKERALVYENAPHVTNPEWMLLPLIKGGTFGPLSTNIGLYVYDILAGVKKQERRKMLSKKEALAKEPLLVEEGLKGAGYYVEYKTDDARLTMEVLKEADTRGAVISNYVKALNFIYNNEKVIGIEAVDTTTGELFNIYAKEIVNATGIWVDELRQKDGSLSGKKLFHSKGVHLVFDQKDFPLKNAVYFDTPDKRMVFAIPREGKTYLGTTDTKYEADLTRPEITEEDKDYLLDAVRLVFPTLALSKDKIESSWVGVRPLIYEEGKSASEISRKDEIFYSKTGLLTIAGGKLTGYRKMAKSVVDVVSKRIGNNKPCATSKLRLSGGLDGGSFAFHGYVPEATSIGVRSGLSFISARNIARKYGTNSEKIFSFASKRSSETIETKLPVDVYAILMYSLKEEMTLTPVDFFSRRTGSVLFNSAWAKAHKDEVIEFMNNYFDWTPSEKELHIEELKLEFEIAGLL